MIPVPVVAWGFFYCPFYEGRSEEDMEKDTRKESGKCRVRHWNVWIIFWKRFLHRILLRLSGVLAVMWSLTGCIMTAPCMRNEQGDILW